MNLCKDCRYQVSGRYCKQPDVLHADTAYVANGEFPSTWAARLAGAECGKTGRRFAPRAQQAGEATVSYATTNSLSYMTQVEVVSTPTAYRPTVSSTPDPDIHPFMVEPEPTRHKFSAPDWRHVLVFLASSALLAGGVLMLLT